VPSVASMSRALAILAILPLLASAASAASAAPAAPAAIADTTRPVAPGLLPSAPQIDAALSDLALDPNLPQEKSVRTLRWLSAEKRGEAKDAPGWLLWVQNLFSYIGSAARFIVWILAALLAAVIIVFILRLLRDRGAVVRGRQFVAPTHVRDLDIRPESLPDDIGAAALALWQTGAQRRALALLYRGVLSRLAHQHQAAVRDSTTEGECIALAAACLAPQAGAFTARLVRTWQRAVYGGSMPDFEQVQALCAGFAGALDTPSAPVEAVTA
jgi:hypothetical protein